MASEKLLPKAVCGHLVQGLVHNMSGPLQILSMQVELLRLGYQKLLSLATPEQKEILSQQEEKLSQIEMQLNRLKDILEAISETTHDAPAPVELGSLLKQMLTLWEADLKFKHQVQKELEASEPVTVIAPPATLWQGFCALFWALVPKAVAEETPFKVRIFREEEPPVVEIRLENVGSLPLEDEFFSLAQKILSPVASLETSQDTLKISFKS